MIVISEALTDEEKKIIRVISESNGIHIRALYKKVKIDIKKLLQLLSTLIDKEYVIERGERAYKYYFVTEKGSELITKSES